MNKRQVNSKPMRAGLFLAVICVAGACVASAADTQGDSQTKTAGPAKAASPAIKVQQLALADRALEFCGPIDADSSKVLKEQIAALVKGASADVVAQARGSESYKAAYSSMDGFIGQIDPRNAKVVCANSARGK
jgi:hypothetical protein